MFEKRYKQGEDAYVARDRFICVTDGVGGWARKLVDAGGFTKEYVSHIATMYDQGDYSSLKDLLDNASKKTKAKGSSTCVMAELREENPTQLDTCNLGDSAYLLVRPKQSEENVQFEKVFRSATQQSRFNAPFQTGTDKRWPTKAYSTSHAIENNDIIIMGSDGVFDNLFDDDIIQCLYGQI